MIKLKNSNYNLILGILFGFILYQIVMLEGYVIVAQKEGSTEIINSNLSSFVTSKIKIIAGIVFFSTVALFNTRKFKKINLDRISIYLILVVLVSFVVTIEGIIIICGIFSKINPNIPEMLSKNPFIMANIAVLFVLGAISIYIITFVLLVNRKVKYIKFLTKEVKVIKNEGFGKTIEVKGGDELSELCQSINDMSVELGKKIENEKRIENNKNELITNISHDLKTPLTSIVGYLELLNNTNLNDETKKEYIKIAYNKSLRLKSLVNELFEYTKLTGNDINLDKNKVNISVLLNQAVGESIINFSEKDIEVILDNPYNEAFCNVDAVQLLRVFENLIKNAEKYGDTNSKFKVSLNIIDKKINISFINKCEGMEEKEIKRLFERFYRQDKSRNKEGSGLGLAIVKRIVELHSGSITAEKIGENIKFNIILDEA